MVKGMLIINELRFHATLNDSKGLNYLELD